MLDLKPISDKELVEYQNRLEYDISKYAIIQDAKKVQLNSAYGATGNPYFRFYDIRLAEAITKSGQLTIRWIEKAVNQYLNGLLKTEENDYVIASDTDSLVVSLEKLVDKYLNKEKQKDVTKTITFINKLCEDLLQPVIDKACEDLKVYLNAPVNALKMKCEILADSAIWITKKRYIMNVRVKEGVHYTEPELKIMGIEAIRTSTPALCRKKIKEALKIILNGDEKELQSFVTTFRNEFPASPVEEIAFPRTVNGLQKYKGDTEIYIKGTPIHVKGSLLYNAKLKDLKLLKRYEIIREGDKIKFVYLKMPNLIDNAVIAFNDVLPKEFGLEGYIDYDLQFEKTFVEPITLILNVIGWKANKQKTIAAFFN
jgi:DNA polymerase elongation subunit (family B)